MNPTLRSVLLWTLALVGTVFLGIYQRTTGPTWPLAGVAELDGLEMPYTLMRTHAGPGDHAVAVAVPDSSIFGVLYWKRLNVDEPFRADTMRFVPDTLMKRSHAEDLQGPLLIQTLPHQPPAGKLEYHLVLERAGAMANLPPGTETTVIRFRGSVPGWLLVPHILFMFGAMLLALRTALAGLAGERVKGMALATLVVLVLGGFLLGPAVQKYAFGAWWTGWPFGEDVTDNKTLAAVLAWAAAVWIVFREKGPQWNRWAVVGAAVIMFAVYLIPHSFRGSSFDYEAGQVTTGSTTEELREEVDPAIEPEPDSPPVDE